MVEPSECGALRHVAVTTVRHAFKDQPTVDSQWERLAFTDRPDFPGALREYDAFLRILEGAGARVTALPAGPGTTLDALYARDASLMTPRGVVLCAMGKAARAAEPDSQAHAYASLVPELPILGRIQPPGTLEGGDVVWLRPRALAVGIGYRTNVEGAAQLRALLGDSIDELVDVHLPHWRGPGDVLHLMSLISPVDRDLAVVYSPLLSVPFRQRLLSMGFSLVDAPSDEFESMGVNVLALAPRHCLMISGNPRTRRALEASGATVVEYEGREISAKGCGGPTCLTRPLVRDAVPTTE